MAFNKKEYSKIYYQKNKEKIILRSKLWKLNNKSKVAASNKRSRIKNRDKIYAYMNRPDVKERIKKYRKTVLREHLKKYAREKARLLRATSIDYRILLNCRRRLCKAVNGICMSETTRDLLGCNMEQLKNHLSSMFLPGMSWENYGQDGWHIDHIIPCAEFDLTNQDQRKKCFHYTNLQPLWAKDNYAKSDKVLIKGKHDYNSGI